MPTRKASFPASWLFVALVAAATTQVACEGNQSGFGAGSFPDGLDANTTRTRTQNGNSVIGNGNLVVGNGNTATNPNHDTIGQGASPTLIRVPLQGCFASDYTAAVRLGDGSSYQLIVDTGSTTLAVAATACTNCSGISPTYTPSAKAQDDKYTTSGAYGDGSSWSGEIYSDTVSMGSANDVIMAFATIDKQSMSRLSGRNFFNASYCSGRAVANASQGIIGFGSSKLELAHTEAYLDKLQGTNSIPDVVATQFCDLGGNLWLGGYDPNTVSAAPAYTAMNTTHGFYEVNMTDMLMDGAPVGTSANYGAAVVDTGTSIMIVTDNLFDALGTALDNSSQMVGLFGPGFLANGSCSEPGTAMTRDALDAALPKMVLQFPDMQGGTMQIELNATDSYLMAMQQPNGTVVYCAAVSSGGGSGGLPNVLLGNSLMHSRITIFDRANNRLGLAPEIGCTRMQ